MSDFTTRLYDQFVDEDRVNDAITAYFAADGDTFTGSQFELLCDSANPNTITSADLVAVSMLSVNVPPRAARRILSDEGQAATGALLALIPTNVDIWDDAAAGLLAEGGPAWTLWDELRTGSWPIPGSGNGMGPTKTSKMLAAKRPRLVPIWDSVVGAALGPVGNQWEATRSALRDVGQRSKIARLTAGAPSHVSLLRRIDAVVWYLNRTLVGPEQFAADA